MRCILQDNCLKRQFNIGISMVFVLEYCVIFDCNIKIEIENPLGVIPGFE